MDLLICLVLFIVCMAITLAVHLSMIIPLIVGFLLFSLLAMKRGFSLKQILSFAAGSCKDSLIVIGILLIIGCLTGLWRQSGTVAYFVMLGISLIPPKLFILAAFLLSAAMSYAIGTSFGVTATAGVILMTIARAGGVHPVWAAGAVMSGVYVGDRGSPAASSANLVSVLTHTDMRRNVRKMLSCSIVPFFMCCLLYGLLSLADPMQRLDTAVLDSLTVEFRLQWPCLIPAALMIILPFMNLSIKRSMSVSLVASLAVSLLLQKSSFTECLQAMLFGFVPRNAALNGMLGGGGMLSMLEIGMILFISGTYGGIFRGTGMLQPVNDALKKLAHAIGRYPVMLLLGAGSVSIFCNQTIGIIMQNQLSVSLYGDSEAENYCKMLDIENSVVLLAGLVPWCIACSVPLGMMGVDAGAIPFAFYLWLLPLCRLARMQFRHV